MRTGRGKGSDKETEEKRKPGRKRSPDVVAQVPGIGFRKEQCVVSGVNINGKNFPGGPEVKKSPTNPRDTGSIPGPEKLHILWSN